jgi:MoxR-like ATPase
MYYDGFLPFLSKGFMQKNLVEEVNIDDVFCPLVPEEGANIAAMENDAVVSSIVPKLYHIEPLGIKVFAMSDSLSYFFATKYAGSKKLVDVTYIDYSDIARRIRVSDGKAFLEFNGGFEIADITTDVFINSAANGVGINLSVLDEMEVNYKVPMQNKVSIFDLEFAGGGALNEGILDDMRTQNKGLIGRKGKGTIDNKVDSAYEWLDEYFKSDSTSNETVPLLIGPTGVFKSATIKELCAKYDYRLVDFRVAFTSRLDYSGLYEKIDIDGKDYSQACPMEELVTCSDGFREYCERALVLLKNKLVKGTREVTTISNGKDKVVTEEPLNNEQIDSINKMINDYTFYAKTPVLFFDEITRNKDGGVEGVLTTLLNQKRFNDMTLKKAKFVAATNLNIDNQSLDYIYDVNLDIDKAYANRFMPIKIFPKEVEGRWFDWANTMKTEKVKNTDGTFSKSVTSNSNIHNCVLKFLEKNSDEVYNEKYVLDEFNRTGSIIDASATSFPNYRTWDLTSSYLYSVDAAGNKEVNPAAVSGLIGGSVGAKFVNFLYTECGYKERPTEKGSELDNFVKDTLDAGTPALLIGPSSLGKTSRIEAYGETMGAEIIHINLAAVDRVDVMGLPTKKSILKFVTGEVDPTLKDVAQDMKKIIIDLQKEGTYGLTPMVTVKAPDAGVKERFKKAYEAGQTIILFFDECNRVTNTTVMSCIFEAISDHRIFGIDFADHKDKVKIVAACNLGSKYKGAKAIDPALSARFAVFKKDSYELSDVDSFVKFLERQVDKGKADPILLNFLKDTISSSMDGKQKLMDWIERVEMREIQNAEPSTRMLYQLSQDIKNMAGSRSMCGKVIFSTDKATGLFTDVKDATGSGVVADRLKALQDMTKYILQDANKWNAVKAGETITANGRKYSAVELIDQLKLYNEHLLQNPTNSSDLNSDLAIVESLVDNIRQMDQYIMDLRRGKFEFYLGAEAGNEFNNYFNVTFGTQSMIVEIPMLTALDLIPDFWKQKLSIQTYSPEELVNVVIDYLKQFYDVFKDVKLTPQHWFDFIMDGISSGMVADNVQLMFTKMGKDLDEYMVRAEEGGNNNIKALLMKAGISVNDSVIDAMKKKAGTGSTGNKYKSKLL